MKYPWEKKSPKPINPMVAPGIQVQNPHLARKFYDSEVWEQILQN